MQEVPKSNPTPKIARTAQLQWRRGMVTTGGRMDTPKDGLYRADNIVINPEGTISSRDPFAEADIPRLPDGVFKGPIASYWDPDGQQFNLLTIVAGNLYMFVAGGSAWIPVPEPSGNVVFSQSQLASYAQYGNLIAICDGKNAMAYFTIPDGTVDPGVVRPGSQINAAPGLALSGGTADGDYRAWYMISYVNDFGETPAGGGTSIGTPAQHVDVTLTDKNNPLGTWSTPVTINITGISTGLGNNTRIRLYRVLTPDYVAPSITNYALVKEHPVSAGATLTLTDDGSVAGEVLSPQLENSTGGLVGRWATEIDGRLWVLGAGKEIQKIYYSGAAPTDSVYPQFFSGDGGYFYVGYGTSYEPVTIKRGRSDDGQICNFALCSGPNGIGRRFNILSLTAEYGNQTVNQFYPSEQKGDEGAYSTFGVLDYMNSILYPSPGGFKSSGIRATYTADNVTAAIDVNIQNLIAAIPYSEFRDMYGTIYNGKALWHRDQSNVLVFDTRVDGAWSIWTMPHQWFGALSVGRDRVALYCVNDSKVLRYTDLVEFKPPDTSGPEYPVRVSSGKLTVKPEDGREWVRLLHVLFVFSEASGPLHLTVRANSRRRLEIYKGTFVANQELFDDADSLRRKIGTEPVDWSDKEVGGEIPEIGDWSKLNSWSAGPFHAAKSATSGLVEVRLRVNKDINFLDWEIESGDGFIGMQLESFVYEYVDIGVGLDFSSRYNESRPKITRS